MIKLQEWIDGCHEQRNEPIYIRIIQIINGQLTFMLYRVVNIEIHVGTYVIIPGSIHKDNRKMSMKLLKGGKLIGFIRSTHRYTICIPIACS